MTLIIGDIHGCYDELQALLDKAAISDDENIIALGDLADKGEQPKQVLDFFMQQPNARSIRGNHEQKHIMASITRDYPTAQWITWRILGMNEYEDAVNYMRDMPLYIELPEALLIHGYYQAGVPIYKQDERVLLGMKDEGYYHPDNDKKDDWHQHYDGAKPVICGHRNYNGTTPEPFIVDERVYGIDTSCVYGGRLTAIKLPQWELISVPSERDHWSHMQNEHL